MLPLFCLLLSIIVQYFDITKWTSILFDQVSAHITQTYPILSTLYMNTTTLYEVKGDLHFMTAVTFILGSLTMHFYYLLVV